MSTAYPNPNGAPMPHQPTGPNTYAPVQPPVQQEKKKGGCLKWGGIGLGILVVLGAFGSCMRGEDGTTPTTSSTMTKVVEETSPAAQDPAAQDPAVEDPAVEETAPQLENAPSPAAPAEADVPVEFKNALKKADTYANRQHMSEAGLYNQLTSEYGEKFSPEAAQYAIDNVQTDYNQNALEKAKIYQERMAMSPDAIYDQLVSEYGEKFTPEQAQFAVDNLPQ